MVADPVAIFADVIAPAPYDYSVLAEANQFPNASTWLGTDTVGRDFLSRLIYGARVSLTVGFSVQGIALLIGVPLGTLAGMLGGWVDYVVMRWVEVLTAIPIWLFALFLISVWRGSDPVARQRAAQRDRGHRADRLGRYLPADARPTAVAARERVRAGAHAHRRDPLHVALHHLLPNALTPLIVAVTLGVPTAIFTEAGLSFLGFGINDPLPSWGKMVADSCSYIRVYWYLGLFPTLLIAITMLSFSFVGDGLRDALDPRLNR